MIIISAKTVIVEKRIQVSVIHNSKPIDFYVTTINGVVQGDEKNISTAYLTYFHDVSEKLRKRHFKEIKEYIEKYIINE